MIKTISAGQGDRSMGAIAEHDYIEKVIELLIGGDWIVNWKTLKSMKIVSFIEIVKRWLNLNSLEEPYLKNF